MFYKIDFTHNDAEELQDKLNHLYGYKNDIVTKVLHRSRLNLFYLLMEELKHNKIINSFDSAIDIGCNVGVYSKIISDFGFKYVLGIDILEGYIKTARDYFESNNDRILKFKVQNAENLDTEKKYDLVLCTEVLEHTNNVIKIIDNIKKLLTPKGIVIISLPNRISFPYLFNILRRKIRKIKFDEDFKQHINYPFFKSINLFKNKNFKIVKITGTNLILFGSILRFFYKKSFFPIINKINFYLSRQWPLKYFTQFLFLILKIENRI